MRIETLPLPKGAKISFAEKQSWTLSLSEKEEKQLSSAPPNHLIAIIDDSSVTFYLNKEEMSFAFPAISEATICYMTRAKGSGWITLEAKLIRANRRYVILETTEYTEIGLKWFLDNKKTLEKFIGQSIDVRDYGFDY
ncbi:hypothetical protein ACJJIF_10460 [Microbulbifer sp. SSSA002]|uniref:hypothetical protein n=1 Tax=unclassified Microbulbifer TaxID=2619833 RepID=UPI00403925BE